MPPVSEKQRRAMFAAKSGKSNIGIPQSVGEDFANADQGGKLPASAQPKPRGLTSMMQAARKGKPKP